MNTEELLVHHRGQGQVAERVHTGVIDDFAVLVFACQDTSPTGFSYAVTKMRMKQRLDWEDGRTFELEGEIVGQVAAFMVASQEEQGVGVPHLQGPQVQHTL